MKKPTGVKKIEFAYEGYTVIIREYVSHYNFTATRSAGGTRGDSHKMPVDIGSVKRHVLNAAQIVLRAAVKQIEEERSES